MPEAGVDDDPGQPLLPIPTSICPSAAMSISFMEVLVLELLLELSPQAPPPLPGCSTPKNW